MPICCQHCGEAFVADDLVATLGDLNGGVILMHRNCALRGLIGSAAHLLGICSCYVAGSTEGDPPELTLRQAADLAVELWEEGQKETEQT